MIDAINTRLVELIQTCEEPRLKEAMLYTALGPGKRMRPCLLLAVCEAVKGSYDAAALGFACCLEMIHAYSLAHDDLPAMDNDDLRRGRPTTHKQFDEATAILAGDALLSHAFEVMAGLCAASPHEHKYVATMAVIAGAAGVNGMIAGQMLDLQSEGKAIGLDTLNEIYRRKTGALFTASMVAGALLGDGTDNFIRNITDLSNSVGLAFQVRDDIFDVESTVETLGKLPGSDEKNQKATYVSLLGVEKAKEMYTEISRDIQAKTLELQCKTQSLPDLIRKIINREH